MKIALVTAFFYPSSQGGTEKYVLNLAKRLIEEYNKVEIITTSENDESEYKYEGLRVHCLQDEVSTHQEIISGKKPSSNLDLFTLLIEEGEYDIIHFHTLTTVFNLFHIAAAKNVVSKIYFTAHVPGITCIHGDLILFGKKACDGLVMKNRCTACYISTKGLGRTVSKIAAQTVLTVNKPKSIATVALDKLQELKMLNNLCDKIFLFTNWQQKNFLKNGFTAEKLQMTTQYLGSSFIPQKTKHRPIETIGFVGRISKEKGLHILIKAFIASNRPILKLHIAGISKNDAYFRGVKKMSEKNQGISWELNLNKKEIDAFYKKIDLLVIPSITYETGPFVLYEAFEKNIPILANDLGDMKIWLERGHNITLYNSPNSLTTILETLTEI